jgi:A/G-specific adenine glycosylase
LAEAAAALLDRRDPGGFNQGMMELGATVCVPRNPLCLLCPVADGGEARAQGTQSQLPVKLKRIQPVRVAATLLAIERAGRLLLWRRAEDAQRLGGFWELPSPGELPEAKMGEELGSFRHTITNRNYTITVVSARVSRPRREFAWLDRAEMERVPLSTTARKALRLLGKSINKI